MKDLCVKLVRFFMVLYAKLPLKFHYFIGDIISWFAKNVVGYRSNVVMVNISRSFPHKNYKELKEIYDGFYRHFGELVAETLWFGGSSYERLCRKGIVNVTNPELVSAMYESSPSLTVLSTHCGNWELMGGFIGYAKYGGRKLAFGEKEISVVYKEMTSYVSDRIFALNRISPLTEVGTECQLESKNVLRFSIKNRDKKRVYIYPADQAPYWKAGRHPIGDFLSQQTYAMIGSMGVACKLSHAVVYMKMKRVSRGRYEMSFIPICENASEFTPEEILRKYYDLLEEEIMETPANWLWSHKRWK